MEEPTPYHIGPAALPESAPTTEKLIARAHAHRQRVPYETGERWLEQLPERLRALADLVLGGKMSAEEIAYALAVLIRRQRTRAGRRRPSPALSRRPAPR